MKALVVILLLAVVHPASAQGFSTAGERRAADVASWVTALGAVALDAQATWTQRCEGARSACANALTKAGLRIGVTYGAVFLAKGLIHEERPCAPDCGIDNPNTSFFSGHTALAFSTLGGPRLAFALPLAVSTGGLRMAAGKHWLQDVAVGAGVGWLSSRIR